MTVSDSFCQLLSVGQPKTVYMREKRDARERKRMINRLSKERTTYISIIYFLLVFNVKMISVYCLSRAFKTLWGRLLNNNKIVSKKQILEQVRIDMFTFIRYSDEEYLGFVVYHRVEIYVGFYTKHHL